MNLEQICQGIIKTNEQFTKKVDELMDWCASESAVLSTNLEKFVKIRKKINIEDVEACAEKLGESSVRGTNIDFDLVDELFLFFEDYFKERGRSE